MTVTRNFTPDLFPVNHLDLTVAGEEIIEQPFNYMAFLRAEDSGGSPTADAEIYVTLGDGIHRHPMGPGDDIPIDPRVQVEKCKIEWDAQPSVGKIYLIFSADGYTRPRGVSPAKIASGTMTVDSITDPVDVNNWPANFDPSFPSPDTVAQKTFIGRMAQTGAAGQYSGAALYNPVGSGVTLYPKSIMGAMNTTGGVYLYKYTGLLGSTGGYSANKTLAGAAPKAALRGYRSATPANFGTETGGYKIVTVASELRKLLEVGDDPFVLVEDEGLFVFGGTVNQTVYANWEWKEL